MAAAAPSSTGARPASLESAHEAELRELRGEKAPSVRRVAKESDGSVQESLKQALAANFGQVVRLFQEWDEDGNNMISTKEVRVQS